MFQMDDTIARKLADLGLDHRGVLSPSQKAALGSQGAVGPLADRMHLERGRLLRTRVAGTSEIDDYERVLADLEPLDSLVVMPSGDGVAGSCGGGGRFALFDAQGRLVGFVPHDDSEALSALAEPDKPFGARVLDIDAHREWADISVDIFFERDSGDGRRGGRRA